MEAYAPEYSVEFPVINFNEHGYKTKYLYFGISFTKVEDSQAARDNVLYPGFIKVDTETRTVAGEVLFGP
jgi:carotenoid cleavage dioxygenase-like enzyme